MVEPILLSSRCYGKFNYTSNDVIVCLKQYEEEDNNQTFETHCILETSDQFEETMSNTEICSVKKHNDNVKKEEMICLKSDAKDLHVIKNSYDTYIPAVVRQKIDCKSRACKNTPGHLRIVTLIEHVMDNADA